jgi:hypothetical protein
VIWREYWVQNKGDGQDKGCPSDRSELLRLYLYTEIRMNGIGEGKEVERGGNGPLLSSPGRLCHSYGAVPH